MVISRRLVLVGAGAALMSPPAVAQARTGVPGGGAVIVPSPYQTKPGHPTYADRAGQVLIAYRNWRSTLSGYPECDGMLGVGRAGAFNNLDSFVKTCRAALSIQWGDADRIPGQAWDGNERRYPVEPNGGQDRPELVQQLSVHRVGFFRVYDEPAHMYAAQHARGVFVAVWVYDKHGGIESARKISRRTAASFEV
jgi:hypothetical protein